MIVGDVITANYLNRLENLVAESYNNVIVVEPDENNPQKSSISADDIQSLMEAGKMVYIKARVPFTNQEIAGSIYSGFCWIIDTLVSYDSTQQGFYGNIDYETREVTWVYWPWE